MPECYLGLISGTSADAIDAALVSFDATDAHAKPQLLATHAGHYESDLRDRILELSQHSPATSLDEIGELDTRIGLAFARTAQELLAKSKITREHIRAIGSHGQTLRHRPLGRFPYTLQIGDANQIAALTGIDTVADFRRRDLAEGGQGAPLVPAFHRAILQSDVESRVVLNLGGIANITVLPRLGDVIGFDTGPANALLDAWIFASQGLPQDLDGAFAKRGVVREDLLERMLRDPYFKLPPPKSTGRDYFHLDWLREQLASAPACAPADVQASLVALVARSVGAAVRAHGPDCARVLVCGGGVHNSALMHALQSEFSRAPQAIVQSTVEFGIDPDHLEAMAFAWLAREHIHQRPGNLKSVTGAKREVVLGTLIPA